MRISDWSSDVCSSDLYGDIDPGRESLPAPSHQRERPTREGARQAIENRQGTESGAPMDLDHDEDGVVIENGHREQKQEGKLEKDLPQTDKSGDSLKGDTPEEDLPATEEEWSLWSQEIAADPKQANRADLVHEIESGRESGRERVWQ